MSGLQSQSLVFGEAEVSSSGIFRIGVIEQAHLFFQREDASDGIINAAHRDLSFLNGFFEEIEEREIIRDHAHVDTGIDGHGESGPGSAGYIMAGMETDNVLPVGNDQAF